ncbi:hypothetical protein NMG60_11008996 [Bertholletia excelsa]
MRSLWVSVALVTTEVMEVGLNTLSKSAMKKGMSSFVLVAYSSASGSLLILLSTLIFYSKKSRRPPRLTWTILCRIFLLGLILGFLQLFVFNGIGFGSPTLASAMNNLTPAYTFLLAILFRMEKLDLKTRSSQAKSLGTIISVGGAFIVTLWKGPAVLVRSSSPLLLISPHDDFNVSSPQQQSWIIGGFVLAVAFLFKALMYIVQTWIIKDYPAELIVSLISCTCATSVSTIAALMAEKDADAWQIRPGIELATIVYMAIYGLAIRNITHIWALRLKGPVFVTMFKPLGIVIAVAMGVIFLGDILYLGSVIGAAVTAVGFYGVMYGKSKEEKIVEDGKIIDVESSPASPLLLNKTMEK